MFLSLCGCVGALLSWLGKWRGASGFLKVEYDVSVELRMVGNAIEGIGGVGKLQNGGEEAI